jgi:ribosome-binding factor A
MPTDRLKRVNVLLRREIAEALPAVMGNDDVDLACLMITEVRVSHDLRRALVLVSVLGHEGERPAILEKLAARRGAFQRLIGRDIRLKFTPVLDFRLDTSIEKGDRILGLLARMEAEETARRTAETAAPPPPPDAPPGRHV